MYRETHGFHVKLKEDSGHASVVFQFTCVMRDTVLVRLQWARSWRNVCCRDDIEEVRVRDECYIDI